MDVKAFPALIVGVVVALVLAGAVLPVFAETTSATDTFTNKGRYYVTTEIEDEVTITMDYDVENNVKSWYVDDVLLEYDRLSGPEFVSSPTVAGTDNFIFRTDGRYRGLASSTGASDYTLSVTNDSITLGSYVGNAPLFIASTEKTDSIMRYSPDTDMYILGDSQIIGAGYTNVAISAENNTNVVISFTGTIKDGVDVNVYNTSYPCTISNVQINANDINGYEDLYTFQSVTFDVTYNDGTDDYVTPCTYSMVVLPSEVTAEKTVHPDGPLSVMLNVLPLLAIAGLVTGAVVWFINRKG